MKATLVGFDSTDLTSVNAARVSMGKNKTEFDSSDERLLDYLYRHVHFTPFTHIRITFEFRAGLVKFDQFSDTGSAGMVKAHDKGMVKMRHSIYGWANLIKQKLLSLKVADDICKVLHELYPHNAKALKIPKGWAWGVATLIPLSEEKDRRFIDATLHLKVPFFIARQEFKHMIGFTRNEISRRYVDTPPEFMKLIFRARPDKSIKQGSGERLKGVKQVAAQAIYSTSNTVARLAYWALLKLNVAPEQARAVLPNATYTEYYVTASLKALDRMAGLRIEGTAQKEIQDLALQIMREVEKKA